MDQETEKIVPLITVAIVETKLRLHRTWFGLGNLVVQIGHLHRRTTNFHNGITHHEDHWEWRNARPRDINEYALNKGKTLMLRAASVKPQPLVPPTDIDAETMGDLLSYKDG